MKRTALGLVVGAFLLIGATTDAPVRPLAIQVEVAPSFRDRIQLLDRPTPNTYTCRAIITSPEAPRGARPLYGALELVVQPGSRESVTEKLEGFDATFTVAVSRKLDRAATEVVVKRGDELLFVQKSDVMLQPPQNSVMPLR